MDEDQARYMATPRITSASNSATDSKRSRSRQNRYRDDSSPSPSPLRQSHTLPPLPQFASSAPGAPRLPSTAQFCELDVRSSATIDEYYATTNPMEALVTVAAAAAPIHHRNRNRLKVQDEKESARTELDKTFALGHGRGLGARLGPTHETPGSQGGRRRRSGLRSEVKSSLEMGMELDE